MKRRDFLKATAGTIGVAPAVAARGQASAPAKKPNIVFVVSDQHRAGLTKRSGYPLDTSPMWDKLAASGVAFERAYVTTPLCVPSRISMLTGRWPEAHRVRMNLNGG